jgi:hypothetical protein
MKYVAATKDEAQHSRRSFGEAAEKGGNHAAIPQGGKKDE